MSSEMNEARVWCADIYDSLCDWYRGGCRSDDAEALKRDVVSQIRCEVVHQIQTMLTIAYAEHEKREGKYGHTALGISRAHVLVDNWLAEQEAKEVSGDE